MTVMSKSVEEQEFVAKVDHFNVAGMKEVIISYRMCLVIRASKMCHAIQTRKFSSSTLTAMSIELLFGQDVPAALCKDDCALVGGLSALMPNRERCVPHRRRKPYR